MTAKRDKQYTISHHLNKKVKTWLKMQYHATSFYTRALRLQVISWNVMMNPIRDKGQVARLVVKKKIELQWVVSAQWLLLVIYNGNWVGGNVLSVYNECLSFQRPLKCSFGRHLWKFQYGVSHFVSFSNGVPKLLVHGGRRCSKRATKRT